MKQEIVDARGGDYLLVNGDVLRGLLKNRIAALQEALAALILRTNNEIPNKEDAVALMIALAGGGQLNERAMFFDACVKRAAFLENEIKYLSTIGHTFEPAIVYKITITDGVRFGL